VFVNSGSRFDDRQLVGLSHFIERTCFKNTASRSAFRLVRDMSQLGANVSSQVSREVMTFTGEVLSEFAPQVVTTLADSILNNSFDEADLKATVAEYEESIKTAAEEIENVMFESIHAAAYQNNSLGFPIMAPLHHIPKFTPEILRMFVTTFFVPPRMVIAGVGIPHAELVKMARPFDEANSQYPVHKGKVQYTGGEVRNSNVNQEDGLTHFTLAFQTASWKDSDLVPMCVLQMMMGGGGSFSAGGPGKGMYSRLYENVLNNHEWANSATCFNSIHSESSLFALYGTCAPGDAERLVDALAEEAVKMAGPVTEVELRRARNQLKSAVFMQLESRPLYLDDLGRQLLIFQKILSADDLAAQIDRVQAADIERVAKKMLQTTPSIAASGDLSYLPRFDTIANKFK